MGLDLIVEACAKGGHEAEWRRFVERAFDYEELSQAETDRFAEISIPAYERLDAPRVGFDSAADAWITEKQNARTPEEIAAAVQTFHGYYVVALVKSDGVPKFSHGGLYDGVDETSFRGKFLELCPNVLTKDTLRLAWDNKMPELAVDYGRSLLAAATAARAAGAPVVPKAKPGLLTRLGLGRRAPDPPPLEEQIEIVEAAGRWFVFWGERGHPIRAWT